MINVLIVDDHPIVRHGLRAVLKDERDIAVTDVSNAAEALAAIRQHPCDLVVLDLDLPGMSGLELLKQIKSDHKRLPVLILTVYPEDQFALRILRAGASGFISKEAAPKQLVGAIRKILAGRKYISERVADLLIERFDGHAGHGHEKLSDREFQILCLFGEGKTIKQIADELSLSAPTVSTYRARILDKLDMRTTAELVKYAIQMGIASPK